MAGAQAFFNFGSRSTLLALWLFVVTPSFVLAASASQNSIDRNEVGVRWSISSGGPKIDWVNRIIRTRDGNIVSVGFKGRDPDPKAAERWTAVVEKYTLNGKLIWTHDFATNGMNAFWAVHETDPSQLIAAGFATSAVGAEYDARLTLLGADGREVFAKNYGGAKDDRATDVLITPDGGYLLVGQTESFGAGERDVFLVKTDKDGNEQWRKAYGGPGMDRGFAAVATADGGYVVIGTTGSEAKID